MSDTKINTELRAKEENFRRRYSMISLVFFIISIIVTLWIVIVFLGTIVWEYGYSWALLSLEGWIIFASIFFIFVILLNFFIYKKFSSFVKKRIDAEKPQPEFIDGKRVYEFTHPEGKEGGIFSKTYIQIDTHHILRLRTLMIPTEELWSKKEE